MNILIIDDEINLRAMMRLAMEAAGHTVVEAADGASGLEQFGDGAKWDVVLLDQRMPDMEGTDVLRRIKERDPRARVVMVTAYASVELAVDAMKAGATDFVRKPMTPEILRDAVTAASSKSSGTAEAINTKNDAPIVQMVTLNGFRILHINQAAGTTNEHRFAVEDPRGRRQTVVVEITSEAVEYVARMTGRRLPLASPFWRDRAEAYLSAFVWNDGHAPSRGRLVLKGVERHELDIAARWDE